MGNLSVLCPSNKQEMDSSYDNQLVAAMETLCQLNYTAISEELAGFINVTYLEQIVS